MFEEEMTLSDEEKKLFRDESWEDFKTSEFYKEEDSVEEKIKAALLFMYIVMKRVDAINTPKLIMEMLTGVEGFDPDENTDFTVTAFTVYGRPETGMNLQTNILPSAKNTHDLTLAHSRFMGSTLGFDASQITTGNIKH